MGRKYRLFYSILTFILAVTFTAEVSAQQKSVNGPAIGLGADKLNIEAIGSLPEDTGALPPQQEASSSNRLIVRFSNNIDHSMEETGEEAAVSTKIKGHQRFNKAEMRIKNLHAKHKIKKARRLFTGRKGQTASAIRQQQQQKVMQNMEAKGMAIKAMAEKTKNMPDLSNYYVIELPEGADIKKAIEDYRGDPDVLSVEKDEIIELMSVPDDPFFHSYGSFGQDYDDLWGIKIIDADKAWTETQGEGVTVAVIDTGVDYTHEDLSENMWINPGEIPGNNIDDDGNGYIDDVHGYDFSYNDPDPMDVHGHGTHVSGTIAAAGNNGVGVIGVAPKAKIMAIKGLSDEGKGFTSHLAEAVKYAADNGAHISNNSWGGSFISQLREDAFLYAFNMGMISFAAAGNSSKDVKDTYPASYPTVISVAASTELDRRTSFSNYGSDVDIAAPGGGEGNFKYNILSTMSDSSLIASAPRKVDDNYYRLAGTSMASPHAAGVGALMVAKNPHFKFEDVRDIIKATSDDIDYSKDPLPIGSGRVNAYKALSVDEVLEIVFLNPDDVFNMRHFQEITGTVQGKGFKDYGLQFRHLEGGEWILVRSSDQPCTGCSLGQIPDQVEDGIYEFRITARDINDFEFNRSIIGTYQERDFAKQKFILVKHEPLEIITGVDHVIIRVNDIENNKIKTLYYNRNTGGRKFIMRGYRNLGTRIFGRYAVAKVAKESNLSEKFIIFADLQTGEELILDNITQVYDDLSIPDVHRNLIVWRNGNNFSYSRLYVYDVNSGEKFVISNDFTDKAVSDPRIAGNRIVWKVRDSSSGFLDFFNHNIYVYDLKDHSGRTLLDKSGIHSDVDIHGNNVTWVRKKEFGDNHGELMLFNLKNDAYEVIARSVKNPTFDRNFIAYEKVHPQGFGSDIYVYDVQFDRHYAVELEQRDQVYPHIYNNTLSFIDESGVLEGDVQQAYFVTLNLGTPFGSVIINDGAKETYSRYVEVKYTAKSTSGVITHYRASNNGETWSDERAIRDDKIIRLKAGGSGTRYYYVQYKNDQGNWSDPVFDSIEYISRDPEGSILINNGDATTDDRYVDLKLDATAFGSEVTHYRLSNNGINWGPEYPYVQERWGRVSAGAGEKFFYVQYKDAEGRWSKPAFDSIYYDGTE